MSEPHDELFQKAVSDRDAHPWRYYRFEWPDAQAWLDKQAETIRTLTAERDGARACLDSLTTDIKEAMGQRYRDAVTEAQGDISVNTAFKVALRDEREDLAALTPALRALAQAVQALEVFRNGIAERRSEHQRYDEYQATKQQVLETARQVVAAIPPEP